MSQAINMSAKTLDSVNDKVIMKYIDDPDKLASNLPFRQIPKSAMFQRSKK